MKSMVLVNTYGWTAAEILLSELASMPGVAMLPGQNFCDYKSGFYRPHDYTDTPLREIFNNLASHKFTTNGKCWMGLTKHMSSEQKSEYDPERHFRLFEVQFRGKKDFLNITYDFAVAFFRERGVDYTLAQYVGYFGHNFVMNLEQYNHRQFDLKVVHWGCSPYLWLAMIGQRLTWNNEKAIQYWLITNLCQRLFARRHPDRYLGLTLDEWLQDRDKTLDRVRQHLGVGPDRRFHMPNIGFMKINRDHVQDISRQIPAYLQLYTGQALFDLADEFDQWSEAYLDREGHQTLIDRYYDYWNSTSHIAFDILGPIERAIVASILKWRHRESNTNYAFELFHRAVTLSSRNFIQPVSHVEHSWGDIEAELVFPEAPYFYRAALCYLNGVLDSYEYEAWTFRDPRAGILYQRLCTNEGQRMLKLFELGEQWKAYEKRIDEVADKVANTHAAQVSLNGRL